MHTYTRKMALVSERITSFVGMDVEIQSHTTLMESTINKCMLFKYEASSIDLNLDGTMFTQFV